MNHIATATETRTRPVVRRSRPTHRRSTTSRWLDAVRGLLPAGSRDL
ncbi:hypothetical protein [Nocardioides speluncae]|nr:hypothetical protein [Nocardioides speluncae]